MTCTDWSPTTNCGTLPDGCGGTIACGTCSGLEVCGGGGPNVCGTGEPEPVDCVYWANLRGLTRLQCGEAPDGMGGTDTCGICEYEEAGGGGFCGGGGVPNACGGCIPYPCWYFGAQCGTITDNCGTQLECGSCEAGESCGAGGVPNQCAPGTCTPTTCAAEGKNCGTIADGCGATLVCGSCTAPETCGGSGTDNVCGTEPGVQTAYTYSAFGELASVSATFAGQTLRSVSYTRDKLGRITQLDETVQGAQQGSVVYTYDAAGRLDTVTRAGQLVADYDYDANGNRTQVSTSLGVMVTATYDDQDRLLTYADRSYTYTAAGELATRVSPAGTRSYSYDALGNLLSVTLEDATVIGYVIDGANRRVGKRVNGTLVQGYLYQDALNPVAELDGAGNVVARFVYGDKANVPAYMIKGGSTYRIISDQLGSVRLVVDVATGVVAQRIDYDEFGVVQSDTAPGFQPFGFAGGLYDAQTGLLRFGVRDYDAEVGRWTSKDPIGFAGGDANLYIYVNNAPLGAVDVSGSKPGDVFPTPFHAGQDALNYVGTLAGKVEHGGYIYRLGENRYTYYEPKRGTADEVQLGPVPPSACAAYHSHPKNRHSRPEGFSDADVLAVKRSGLPEFLRTPYGNHLYLSAETGEMSVLYISPRMVVLAVIKRNASHLAGFPISFEALEVE